ncbi:methyltransferase domain-containing protein [Candidatus Pelagibacter sp.]|nr:methyltransferase domain-containing protein [Candidatus Pelagibacter sp.]
MRSLKNWDNKTWLSSKSYIQLFNKFITKQNKLNRYSRILDIGCGRGKITGNLATKFKLINKPIGLDVENNKDKSKKIIFKKIDAITYLSKTKITFDLILIKQTIHLLKKNQILRLLSFCKNKLNSNGKIIILSLDPNKNEIPTFSLMKKKLEESLKRDKKIFELITKTYPKIIIKNFIFKVVITKNEYLKMIKKKYISTLLSFTDKQIKVGLNEINLKYKNELNFKDRLICLILKR